MINILFSSLEIQYAYSLFIPQGLAKVVDWQLVLQLLSSAEQAQMYLNHTGPGAQ